MSDFNPATPPTVHELLGRMDTGWTAFRAAVGALPNEVLEAHISDGAWTRKQMLAHIGAWHDLTVDRLVRYRDAGEPPGLDEGEDTINARTARSAAGRTTGEIVQGVDDSFRRLRREVERLSDEQLGAHEWWALATVVGNSFGHYEEHLADLQAG